MTKNVTTWTLNTCGCVVHYEWDGDVPDADRVHTGVEGVTTYRGEYRPTVRCPLHPHPHPHDHYLAVLAHHLKKNREANGGD